MNQAPELLDWQGNGREVHTVQQTRAIEAELLARQPKGVLMQAAGTAVARLCLALGPTARRVWVAAGPGNNGGDGLVAARLLHLAGWDVRVGLVNGHRRAESDAEAALQAAIAAGVRIDEGAGPPTGWRPDFAIDALLGLGQSRAVEGMLAAAVHSLNALPKVLAVDVPTGLNADTGTCTGAAAVRATHTLSLLTLKPGLFMVQGRDHCGQIWLHRLGRQPPAEATGLRLCGRQDAQAIAPTRSHASHKGSYGEVLVIGGAPSMAGAAILAAQAAGAAGPGKVFLSLLDENLPLLSDRHPDWMLRARAWLTQPELLRQATIVCGCGGGTLIGPALAPVLKLAPRLVLDADALNQLAANTVNASCWRSALKGRAEAGHHTVLTPHPLEAARLLGCSTAAVQADRLAAARALAQRTQAVVLLKGSGTVLATPEGELRINPSGNARLAVAGSGDVLAGWMGGLWAAAHAHAHDLRALDVAAAAVWQHGLAAERSIGNDGACETGLPTLSASKLVTLLRH